jgi:nicotinamide phosphoribosyltransferase
MKSTYQECNGVSIEIFKDPKTDDGIKKSAKGLLRVEKIDGCFVTYDQQTWLQESQGELKAIFKDGNFMNRATLVSVRENLLK